MSRFSLSGLFKFLVGIVLVQGATGVLVVAALRTEQKELWALFGLLSFSLSLLSALWFTSIVGHAKRDAVSDLREDFLREREKIRIQAERDKARVVKTSHQQIIRDRGRTQTRANIKSSAAVVGIAGVGAVMLLSQFFTIGLITLAAAGGAVSGYAYRSRQQRTANTPDRADAHRLPDASAARRALRYLSRGGQDRA